MESFYVLVRHLILVTLTFHDLITFFLVILLHFWLQNKKTTAWALIFDIWSLFFCLVYGYSFTSFLTSKPKQVSVAWHLTLDPCSFAWFIAIKLEKESFWDLIKTLFLVLLLCLWLQNQNWKLLWLDQTLLLVLMFLTFNKGSFYNLQDASGC